ncbi:hypothetical protein GCM10025867_17410 [Frondihabitans sucicola]|uniref:Uncharacterized protein n=1 Tax=Frondihabitans sucicola TaxID=1268041 RepID=A0ABM8GMR2_9MICO|nr:hypothetical protein [Frondihabitans sucicola]BDZ49500.1 hypothetical protein GCM10025867_17410 [Frondihabitans sucicola]
MLVGLAGAAVGLLPWLVHGAHLTLQNLWATPTVDPADMPLVLLPFSQYQLDLVAGTIIVGSAVAGLAARVLARRGHPGAALPIGAGLLAGQVAALAQTGTRVSAGLAHPGGVVRLIDDSTAYLLIVVAWILLSIAVGATVFLLLTRTSASPVVLAIGIAAVVLGPWLRGFVAPITDVSPSPLGLLVAHWAPAVAVGAAVASGGLRTVRRIIAASSALALLWVGTAALGGLAAAAGSRALLRLPDELAAAFALVMTAELRGASLLLVAAAAAVALAGVFGRWALVRPRLAG